jgi:hypothetical protein
MIILGIMLFYALLRGKAMIKREDWSLIQQTVVSSLGELQVPRDLKDEAYQNISIGIQFIRKPAK